ncbi:hypothetical protein HOO65_080252 [Ceratocystis lukuohia]|uniref:Transmembrane protein n=1 Tax=Ceratocystis lukuohia TaxID=2019550 RepID=A0ABR4MAK0_9PEZI
MKQHHRPPPLVLSNSPASTTARPPVDSNEAEAARTAGPNSRDLSKCTGLRCFLGIVAETAHTVVCMFMMLMLAFYLNYDEAAVNRSSGPPAITLIILLSIDMILNFYSIAHFDKPLTGWVAFIKCILIFSYIVIFLVYLASDGPFPKSYSFWGIKADYTSVIVYSLIWIISVWDLAIIVINRKTLLYWFVDAVDMISQRQQTLETASIDDKQFEAAGSTRLVSMSPFVGRAL